MIPDKICFVISPIGKEGSEVNKRFRRVLDRVIRPAFEGANLSLKVIRADDIQRPGAIIRDILKYIASAHTVVADLTGQNPNVFYELGVRHALSPRTILIAQNSEDVPSDLSLYRTIIYKTSPSGVNAFRKSIQLYLKEIEIEPERPDNPVLDELKRIVPSVPDDLRQSFAARLINIGTKQRFLLKIIQKRTVVPGESIDQAAVGKEFRKKHLISNDSEIYYRLEQLRLLGFIIKEKSDVNDLHIYRLSPDYSKEIGLTK
jgi:hypothetical protein